MMDDSQNFRCEKCNESLSICAKCGYKFELSTEFMRCLEIGNMHYHFCNDDCLIDYVFENHVSDSCAI